METHAHPGEPIRITLPVDGMTCAACQANVQRALTATPGVTKAAVNLMMHEATVQQQKLAVVGGWWSVAGGWWRSLFLRERDLLANRLRKFDSFDFNQSPTTIMLVKPLCAGSNRWTIEPEVDST